MLKDSKRSRSRLRSEYFPFIKLCLLSFTSCIFFHLSFSLASHCQEDVLLIKMKDQEESKSEIIVNFGLLYLLLPCG